jgi:hypothetical protein
MVNKQSTKENKLSQILYNFKKNWYHCIYLMSQRLYEKVLTSSIYIINYALSYSLDFGSI